MNHIDPATLTLVASCIGALLFFCAGMVWNHRPREDQGASWEPSPLLSPPAATPSSSPPPAPAPASAPASAQPRSAPPLDSPESSFLNTPRRLRESPVVARDLRAALEQLTAQLEAQSILILDDDGLLFTEGRDAAGAGLRLASALEATRGLDDLESPARAFELGKLRFQQLPGASEQRLGAWLATTGADRFCSSSELKSVSAALQRELHI